MSESRGVYWLRALTHLGVVACLLLIGTPMRAQTSDELTVRLRAMRDSLKATQARLETERLRLSLILDDSVVSDGVTFLFPQEALTDGDRGALRDGIARAKQTLTDRFGTEGARLLDAETTSLNFRRRANGKFELAIFADGRTQAATTGVVQAMPLTSGRVENYLLGRAGRRLLAKHPALDAFAGGAFSLVEEERDYYVARRQLTTSRSSVARRCAAGSLSACRTILDPRVPTQWFAPDDSVPRNGIAIPRGVNGSLVSAAVELGGARAIEALGRGADGDEPVAILAEAAGVTPDSLLLDWSSRLQDAGESTATPSLPFAAIAFAWCGVFLFAATRRRPR